MSGAGKGTGGYGERLVSRSARRRLQRNSLPTLCALIGGSVALSFGLSTPGSGDAPSHLFQTWLFSHRGFQLWNNYWYAGRYEFVTYSVFYYPLAAALGQLAVVVPAAALLTGGVARVLQGEWGLRAV